MDTLESSSSGERSYVGQSVVGESILFREYPVDIKHVLGLSTSILACNDDSLCHSAVNTLKISDWYVDWTMEASLLETLSMERGFVKIVETLSTLSSNTF